MTIHEKAIEKIQALPEPLAQEVDDFIDFLLMKNENETTQHRQRSTATDALSNGDFADYLKNLEDYETRLTRGEVKW